MEWIPVFLGAFKGAILIIGMIYAIKWHYDQDRKAKDAADSPQSPTEMRLFVTMLAAIGLSVVGIAYAGCWGQPADGGRGGALGCVLTFLMAIIAKSDTDSLDHLARLHDQTGPWQAAVLARLESARREKVYLGVAGMVSAIAWKFGGDAAAWLHFGA